MLLKCSETLLNDIDWSMVLTYLCPSILLGHGGHWPQSSGIFCPGLYFEFPPTVTWHLSVCLDIRSPLAFLEPPRFLLVYGTGEKITDPTLWCALYVSSLLIHEAVWSSVTFGGSAMRCFYLTCRVPRDGSRWADSKWNHFTIRVCDWRFQEIIIICYIYQ